MTSSNVLKQILSTFSDSPNCPFVSLLVPLSHEVILPFVGQGICILSSCQWVGLYNRNKGELAPHEGKPWPMGNGSRFEGVGKKQINSPYFPLSWTASRHIALRNSCRKVLCAKPAQAWWVVRMILHDWLIMQSITLLTSFLAWLHFFPH